MTKYSLHRQRQLRRPRWVLVTQILLASVLTCLLLIWVHHRGSGRFTSQGAANQSAATSAPHQIYTGLTGRYLFNGTVVWARAVEKYARHADGTPNYAQPFSQLNTFDRAAYDAWSTDFECPITDHVVP